MKTKKAKNVVVKYNNEEVYYLKGREAARWMQTVNDLFIFASLRSINFPKFKWEKLNARI